MDSTVQTDNRFRAVALGVLALTALVFCARNLPWTLAEYDQAKQAYVPFEILKAGRWWFQHTPLGYIATKPPLAGWISVALYAVLRSWDLAWRLPPLLSGLAILVLLFREGNRRLPVYGGAIAAGAFGLNMLAMRLATLVRTDMMLTMLIFLAGLAVLRHIENDTPWTARDRGWMLLLVLASLFTKGPVIYTFFVPALLVSTVAARRQRAPNRAWCGWSPWLVPFALFLVWVGVGIATDAEFYRQVVLREFGGKFVEIRSVNISKGFGFDRQPFWFYVPHYLHKWAPWSLLLLVVLCADRQARSALVRRPGSLWLAGWAAGGFVVMSCIMAKRVDRLFPIVPALSLLLVDALAHSRHRWFTGRALGRTCRIAVAVACLWAAYAGGQVIQNRSNPHRVLQKLARETRDLAAAHGWRTAILGPDEEAWLLYFDILRFSTPKEAEAMWHAGEIDALVGSEEAIQALRAELGESRIVLRAPAQRLQPAYVVLAKPEPPGTEPP